ncbi:MAG: D-2-hydroxyacid dehydrogenase [Treponema sp.]|jgi:phosphoglycerate dehydrogenase-like enzyme|nr:D-2-hydroxyacid dehydrogenase [Treponema sp.]
MDQDNGIILVTLPQNRMFPGLEERLRQAGGGRELVITSDPGGLEKAPVLQQVEILIGFVPWHLISQMPHLRWVQLWTAGADGLQYYPELKDRPFMLTSTSGMHGQQLTEHIFGLLLAWNRRFPPVFAAQKQHAWIEIPGEAISLLGGKTMLILGYGSIGMQVAQVALAFGMQVIALRRHVPDSGQAEGLRIESIAKLKELLPQADVVVNILPLTQDTKHIISTAELGAMKDSALYINVGRGPTTDEKALIEALKAKRIAGALLDVTETEPLPPGSPLWDMDNVIITGHYAGVRPDYSSIALEITLDNLGRYLRGEALHNLVNKNAGY